MNKKINIKHAFKDAYYKYPDKCTETIKSNDRNLFKGKVKNDFYQNLACSSEDTGFVSNEGHKIKYSYCSWREAFFKSTNRKDLNFFVDMYCTTGAMCFTIFNYGTNEYDYIISLNSDSYTYISDRLTILSYTHELGHCLLDHPSHHLEDDIRKRDIAREIAADNAGFIAMVENNFYDLNEYKDHEYLVGSEGFRLKHVGNCGMMIYGKKNMDIISNVYEISLLDCLEAISKRFLKLSSSENEEEDKAREENFKSFLSTNL